MQQNQNGRGYQSQKAPSPNNGYNSAASSHSHYRSQDGPDPLPPDATPTDAFNHALKVGGPENAEKLKSKLRQKTEENNNLKEDNKVLLARIEKMKTKYDKVKSQTDNKVRDQTDLLEKIAALNDIVDELRKENEELRVGTVAKQLDLDNLKKQITEGSATPLMFAKDNTR